MATIPPYRKYYPVPPVNYSADYMYINVNKNVNLRKDVTLFFQNKILKWINKDDEYSKFKHHEKYLESLDGQMYIYSLLRKFVKKYNINWYELRSDYYNLVKKYLAKKLNLLSS